MKAEDVHVPEHIPDEDRDGYVARIMAEAEASQADERAKLKTIGHAAFGLVGLIVSVYGLVWTGDLMVALVGAIGSALGFGVITAGTITDWIKAKRG